MKPLHLLLDSANGVYIPKIFAESHSAGWSGIYPHDLATLLKGPEDEEYWDTWNDVLNNAIFTDVEGMQYRLHHDGDLWMWCPGLMTWQDYEEFFGEEPPEVCVTLQKYGSTLALRYTYGETGLNGWSADFTLLSEVGESWREAAAEARDELLKRLGLEAVPTDIDGPPWVVEKVAKVAP